jgi:hypothetical protein
MSLQGHRYEAMEALRNKSTRKRKKLTKSGNHNTIRPAMRRKATWLVYSAVVEEYDKHPE